MDKDLTKLIGRRPIIDSPTRQRLVFAASQDAEHRRMPMIEVARELGIEAAKKTIRKAFQKEGYARRVARKKPLLTQAQKEARLEWALQHRHWTADQWENWVLFTDECYMWTTGSHGRVWVTRTVDEEYYKDCIVPGFSKDGSVMIWGGIMGGKKTELFVWERNDYGNINSDTYVRHILVPIIWPFIVEHSYAQGYPMQIWTVEDGASSHTSAFTEKHREYYGIKRIWWPANSPDLNPIENVWQLLKNIIKNKRPYPRGTAAIKQAVLEAWEEISSEDLRKLVRSMPERIEAVIAAGGGHTR